MNVLASECSSGCESGWTLYLDHSFLSPNAAAASHGNTKDGGFCEGGQYCEEKILGKNQNDDEEEEDLSMVSDASSGPPHVHEDQYEGYFNDVNGYQYPASRANTATTMADTSTKTQKRKERRCREKEKHVLPSFLDDTASSPVFNFSSSRNEFAPTNNNQDSMESVLDYSQAFSATHFQGRSAFQGHYGFLQPSSLSGNHLQNNQWY